MSSSAACGVPMCTPNGAPYQWSASPPTAYAAPVQSLTRICHGSAANVLVRNSLHRAATGEPDPAFCPRRRASETCSVIVVSSLVKRTGETLRKKLNNVNPGPENTAKAAGQCNASDAGLSDKKEPLDEGFAGRRFDQAAMPSQVLSSLRDAPMGTVAASSRMSGRSVLRRSSSPSRMNPAK